MTSVKLAVVRGHADVLHRAGVHPRATLMEREATTSQLICSCYDALRGAELEEWSLPSLLVPKSSRSDCMADN